jgi:hypothetical protein
MALFNIICSILSNKAITFPKRYQKLTLCMLSAISLIIQLSPNASASVSEPVSEQQMVTKAEIIFEGVVHKIEYRLSNSSSKYENPIPHTFVTFKIEKIFKGKSEDKESITLRFAGGPYDKSKLLLVSGIPLFDVGDRDILFVTGNGIRICPLVGWSQGRIRIIKGKVYTDDGREVWLSDKNHLEYGLSHIFEEVQNNRISGKLLRKVHMDEKNEKEEPKLSTETTDRSLSYKKFASYVSQLIINNHDPNELKNLRPVKSANIKDAFFFHITPVRPPFINTGRKDYKT